MNSTSKAASWHSALTNSYTCCLLGRLTALDLLASELTASGLSALSKLPQLEELKLYQAGVTAEGLVMLAGQPAGAALHSLVLYGTGALRDLACLGEHEQPSVAGCGTVLRALKMVWA